MGRYQLQEAMLLFPAITAIIAKENIVKKNCLAIAILLGLAGFLTGYATAGETGHYVSGVEGIKAASVPPPGMYLKSYNAFYTAGELTDKDGDNAPVDFDLTVFVSAFRYIWVTDYTFFGGNFFVDATIPFIYTDIEIGAFGVDDDEFAVGDINIEPLGIAWHGNRFDAAFGFSVYAPTGKTSQTNSAAPGKDFWTQMFTVGGTLYMDTAKTWTASVLARYEFHSEKDDADITPGDDFHFEWGISKNIDRVWDLGLTGYCHWQVTDDKGKDVAYDQSVHDRVYAIGPEVSRFFPAMGFGVSLRSQFEFESKDRTEGNITTLTLTKIF
jgi:hypothetical protein